MRRKPKGMTGVEDRPVRYKMTSKYADLKALVAGVRGCQAGAMTIAWDELLTYGAPMNEFVRLGLGRKEEFKINTPINEDAVMTHFKGRIKQNGWDIENVNGNWKVVGVDSERGTPRSDTREGKEFRRKIIKRKKHD